jgi:uncharacterized membrane protein
MNKPALSGAWIGLGILIKNWPVLALPSMLVNTHPRWNKLVLLGTAILIPVLGIGLYLWIFDSDPITTIKQAVLYNHGTGHWGYHYLLILTALGFQGFKPLAIAIMLEYGRSITLVILGLAFFIRIRKESAQAGLLTLLVTFFAVTHAFATQYLMWLVPFALLNREHRWLRLYTLAAFAYIFLFYNTYVFNTSITNLLPIPQARYFLTMPAGMPVWLVTVAWAYYRLAGKSLNSNFEIRNSKTFSTDVDH